MAKLSINEAAKRFRVSRPTLLKHLKEGRISGENATGNRWEIDIAELARVYEPRKGKAEKAEQAELPSVDSALHDELKAENERLKAELAVAQALADERAKRLDQFSALLPGPKKRRWWPF